MPRLTREQQQARTRARVLAAARNVFETSGYAAASLEEIAAAADCTRGAIYPQFGGKAGLFLAVLDSIGTGQLSRWESLAVQGGSDEQLIVALGELIAAEAQALGSLRRAVREYAASCAAPLGVSEQATLRAKRFDDAVSSMCQRLGDSSSLSPEEFGAVVRALANGLWIVQEEDASVDIARLFSTSLSLLLGRPATPSAHRGLAISRGR